MIRCVMPFSVNLDCMATKATWDTTKNKKPPGAGRPYKICTCVLCRRKEKNEPPGEQWMWKADSVTWALFVQEPERSYDACMHTFLCGCHTCGPCWTGWLCNDLNISFVFSLSSGLCKLPILYFHTWRKEVAARRSGALWQDYTSRNLLTTELLECVHSWRARYYNIPLSTSLFKMDWCCFLKRKKCNGIFSHSSSISLGISMSVGLSVVFEILSEIWNNVSFVVPRG